MTQDNEGNVIAEYFHGFTGRVLDIGCHDGKWLSNSAALIEDGWRAVLVDGSPRLLQPLVNNYGDNDRVLIVIAAMDVQPRLAVWYDNGGSGVDSLDAEHVKDWRNDQGQWREILLHTTSISELLAVVGQDFDFVTIDAEGTSWALLRQFPWKDMPTQLVCVEREKSAEQMQEWMAKMGFDVLAVTGTNFIFRRKVA